MGQTIHSDYFHWKDDFGIGFNQVWPILKFDPTPTPIQAAIFIFMQITHTFAGSIFLDF